MKKLLLACLAVATLLMGPALFAEESAVGDPWGSGTTTITRFLTPANKTTWWYVTVAPETQNVLVVYYISGSPVDTFTVLAGDVWNTPASIRMDRYDIERTTATDGIDYATRRDGRG